MRALFAGFVLVLSSSLAFAQQPPASTANSRSYVSAADVTALIAQAATRAGVLWTAHRGIA